MSAWAAAARETANLSRLSACRLASLAPPSASLIHRRGLAGGGGDHNGPPKVNFWQDPLSPSKWKEEHFVIVSLAGWGCLFYGGYKFFTKGNKGEKKEEVMLLRFAFVLSLLSLCLISLLQTLEGWTGITLGSSSAVETLEY